MGNPDEPLHRVMESAAEASEAIGEVIAQASQTLRVFDETPRRLRERDFGSPARIEALRQFLHAGRNRKLMVALHETAGIESELPRLVTLLGNYSGQVAIHRTLDAAREAHDPMVIADGAHFWHKLHIDHPRSVLTLHNAVDTQPILGRFEEIWSLTELGVSGSSLGL